MMEKPLFWHQGLFLQPQHLQLASRYGESLNQPLYTHLQPHFWGVGRWRIQAAALNNQQFQLAEGSFLFPDMTYAVIGENALIMPRSFEGAWEEGTTHFSVYIGLRKLDESGKNVSVISGIERISQVATRWVTTTPADQVPDLHQDGPVADVQRLQYVLKLFWETEKDQLGDYDLIPLAQLEKDQESFRLSKRYIPPCLSIGADTQLLSIIKEIRDQIGARTRQLEGYKRDRGLHSAEFGARDMVYLLALRSLNRYAPLLAHMAEARHGHPWNVYGLLRQMIGELSTFSAEISFNGRDREDNRLLPPYQHGQIGTCFGAALALITRLLDQITAGPEHVIALSYDGTYYGADLPPAIFEGRNRFYLVLETTANPQDILSSLQRIAKLGCRESLPILIARSLSGVGLTHLDQVPQALSRRSNAFYFQIDHHSDQWIQVQNGKNCALYWDTAPEDLKVELMVVGRRT
jgi:type VI secretion system protein ImpJ